MNPKPFTQNLRDANQVGIELLLTDAEMALTLLDTAQISSDAEGRVRRIGEARNAYNTILHLLSNLTLDEPQLQELSERMSLLRSRLAALGALEDPPKPD